MTKDQARPTFDDETKYLSPGTYTSRHLPDRMVREAFFRMIVSDYCTVGEFHHHHHRRRQLGAEQNGARRGEKNLEIHDER